MLKLNYYLQLVLLSVSAIILVASWFDKSLLLLILLLQGVVGGVQYLISTVLICSKLHEPKLVRIHWGISTIVLCILFFVIQSGITINEGSTLLIGHIIPWGLAIYFFVISYQLNYPGNKKVKYRFLNTI